MKKYVAFLAVLMMPFIACAGNTRNGPYLGGHVGFDASTYKSESDKENDTRFMWDVALGARARSVRVELELANTMQAHLDDVKMEQFRYMAQFYYDIRARRSAVYPFINVGLGVASTDMILSEAGYKDKKDDDATFCWNVGAGIGLDVNSWLSFDIGYRYIDAGRAKFFNGSEAVRIRHHEGYTGLRFTF